MQIIFYFFRHFFLLNVNCIKIAHFGHLFLQMVFKTRFFHACAGNPTFGAWSLEIKAES